nr:elongation factor P [Chloroflexota bacterium]
VLGVCLDDLKDLAMVDVVLVNGGGISVKMPSRVELEVKDSPPSFRGELAKGGNKPATLETGLVVTVPMFITPGTIIRVDTRTGEYTERVS